MSYITAPFARSPPSKGLPFTQADIAVEQKSESGSEDEWNGQPSEQMHGKDVFDLAQAAGRDGADFDSRADQWRARGEKAGGRRETSRKALFVSAVSLSFETSAVCSVSDSPSGFPEQTYTQSAQVASSICESNPFVEE